MYSRILVPVDLDHVDKLTKALDLAVRTARENDATIVYADVVDAVPTMTAQTESAREADRLRKFVTSQAELNDVDATDHVALRSDLRLNVGSDVVKVAKELNCDLIIMASHVPGFKEHFFSSNAGYVASHAPVSVYVVR